MTNLVITFYCACRMCCGPDAAGLTASGIRPLEGITCAANRYPLGTRLYIAGIGERVVQDRTARRFSDRVDVYINDHRRALRLGKLTRSVTNLGTVPAVTGNRKSSNKQTKVWHKKPQQQHPRLKKR